ncbi:MAG: putative CRISPR-associated protein [Thermoanaerobacteraceae bacterium]|nr:putative CRISPR-associated protein [Thermoanaerobacteraceae bacterium]
MYGAIVMTGGISLFSRNNIFGRETREREIFNFERTNPVLKSPGQDVDEAISDWLKEMKEAAKLTRDNPRSVSAEYSMLYALRENGKLSSNPVVTIVHTDTLGGKAAAMLLQKIAAKDFNAYVQLRELPELDVCNRTKLHKSLGLFMECVAEELKAGNRYTTCFAPIGGYKVMTSYGYITGSFLGYPTAYLHEDNQVLVEIPPIPVQIDEVFIEENSDLIRKLLLEEVCDWNELSQRQQQAINDNSFLFYIVDDMVQLNAFGHFVFTQPEYAPKFSTKVYFSGEARKVLNEYPSAETFAYQQVKSLITKVKSDPGIFRGELYHEADFSILNGKDLQFSLYKGASNGRHVFRAAWRYDKDEDKLYINYLWLTKPYEHDVKKGKGLTGDFDSYQDVSELVYGRADKPPKA